MPSFTFLLGTGSATVAGLPNESASALFGKDLRNVRDLDAGGDFLLVEEEEALREAVLRRLLVRPGEYKLRPSYGVGAGLYVKRAISPAARDELRLRILENLARDDRIDRVLEATVEPTTLEGKIGLRVALVVQSRGRTLRFQPFDFREEV